MISRFDAWPMFEFPPEGEALDGLPDGDCVYVFFWAGGGATQPFYVGQTKRLANRMDDYLDPSFYAATDFKVGEAANYLRHAKGLRIFVRHTRSQDSLKDEKEVIRELQLAGVRLLNDFVGYDYHKADKRQERADIHRFCDVLLSSALTPGD